MVLVALGEPKLVHILLLDLVKDIEGNRHVIVIDNIFSSIGVFSDLLKKEFMLQV